MKLIAILALALTGFALASPVPEPAAEPIPEPKDLEKRRRPLPPPLTRRETETRRALQRRGKNNLPLFGFKLATFADGRWNPFSLQAPAGAIAKLGP
jgi:hypothetical protein